MSRVASALFAVGRRPWGLCIGLIVVAQAFYLQWHPAYPNPNEVIRLYLARAIVEQGTVQVDAQIARFGQVEDKSFLRGHFYCDKAPGVSFASVPAIALARLAGDVDMKTARHLAWYSAILLPSTLLLLSLWRMLGRYGLSDPLRAMLLCGFGLGSLQFTFSTVLFSHALAGSLAMSAFLTVSAYKRGEVRATRLLFAGFAAAFATISEYPAVIAVAPLFLWLCLGRGWRRAWLFVVGALPPVAAALLYHQLAFGHPLATGYSNLHSDFFAEVHRQGFMGVSTPTLEAFLGSFVRPSRGVFAYAPWLLLTFPGLLLLWRRRSWRGEFWVIASVLVGYAYFVSAFGHWVGGGTIGQRHFTPAVPFLLVPVAEVFRWVQGAHGGGTPSSTPRSRRIATVVDVCARSLIAAGIVITALASVPWPFASPAYANPLWQIAVPFWRDRILPVSAAELLGLSVTAAAWVYVGLVVVAVLIVAYRRATLAPSVGAVLSLTALLLAGHARMGRGAGDDATPMHDRQNIANLVDGEGRRPSARERAALLGRATLGPLRRDELLRLGQLHAAQGEARAALERYRQLPAAPEEGVSARPSAPSPPLPTPRVPRTGEARRNPIP